MELHEGEQLIWRGHPAARSHLWWLTKWGAIALAPVSFAGIMRLNDRGVGMAYWKWVALSVLLLLVVIIIDVVRRALTDYIVTTQRIRIRRGVLNRQEQSTVIEKVQNINTNQSLGQRLLGIGEIDFDTAGTEASDASFRFTGVAKPGAIVRRLEAQRVGVAPQ